MHERKSRFLGPQGPAAGMFRVQGPGWKEGGGSSPAAARSRGGRGEDLLDQAFVARWARVVTVETGDWCTVPPET
jgi:hypothetical protein